MFEFVLYYTSVPLNEIDDPSQQDRRPLVDAREIVWSQMLVEVVQYLDDSLNQALLNLGGI